MSKRRSTQRKRSQNVNRKRRLILERLEARWLLAAGSLDTSGDGSVTALDALLIINALDRRTADSSSSGASLAQRQGQFDINGDGVVTAFDALLVINSLPTQKMQVASVSTVTPNDVISTTPTVIAASTAAADPFEVDANTPYVPVVVNSFLDDNLTSRFSHHGGPNGHHHGPEIDPPDDLGPFPIVATFTNTSQQRLINPIVQVRRLDGPSCSPDPCKVDDGPANPLDPYIEDEAKQSENASELHNPGGDTDTNRGVGAQFRPARVGGLSDGYLDPGESFEFIVNVDVRQHPPERFFFEVDVIAGVTETPVCAVCHAVPGVENDTGKPSVFLHNGEYRYTTVDLEIPGRGFNWRFERTYRSDVSLDGPLGHNWDHNYNRRLHQVSAANERVVQFSFPDAKAGDVVIFEGENRSDIYVQNPDGSFNSPRGYYTNLVENPGDGSFSERRQDGTVITYDTPDADGIARMTSWSDRNDNTMTFQYNGDGLLKRVVDTLGRPIDYFYNADNRLIEVRDFFDRSILFEYDDNDDLVAVTSPAVTETPTGNDFENGKTEIYEYSSGFDFPLLNHDLLSVTAPNEVASGGPPRIQLEYETSLRSGNVGQVIQQTLGGTNDSGVPAGGTIEYEYEGIGVPASPDDVTTPVWQTTVTDRNGNETEYQFNQLNNILSVKEFTNRDIRSNDPEFFETRFDWNSDYEPAGTTFHEGNTTEQTYDVANLDRFQQGNLTTSVQTADARGGDQDTIVSTNTFEPIYNQIRTSTDARGNDDLFVPPIPLAGEPSPNPDRYTTTYTFDYQEGNNLAGLAAELGITIPEVQQRLNDAGIVMNLGDVNGDGITNQINGNVIRIEYPTVNHIPGSNQALLEGDTEQEIVELYVYNAFGQLIEMTDPEGNVDVYVYNREDDPDGDGTLSDPPADGRLLDTTTGGYLKETIRDAEMNPLRNSGTDPEITEIRMQYSYDPVGNVTREVDGRGIVTDYAVNQLNQVVQITRAAAHDGFAPDPPDPAEPLDLTDFGYLERVFYDFNDNVVLRQVEDRGNTSNVDGNLPLEDLPALISGQTGQSSGRNGTNTLNDTTQAWAVNQFVGQLVRITGGAGAGQVLRIVSNSATQLVLDSRWRARPNSRSTYVILPDPDPFGDTAFVDSLMKYDILDNQIEMLEEVTGGADPHALRTRYRYDANENQVLTILPEGNATTAIYDERDLLFRTTRGATVPAERFRENPRGTAKTLLARLDPTRYDVRGGFPCQCTTFVYDGNRNVIETSDADDTDLSADNNSDVGPGDRTRYIYDGFDRLTSVIDSVGNQTVYQYDPVSNVVRTTRFGPVGGPSPTSDGPDDLAFPVSTLGVIQVGNLVNDNLLEATESLHDELNRNFQTDRVLFVNTIPMVRVPDVQDGATDIGGGNLTPGDNGAIPGLIGVSIIGRVSTRNEYDRNSRTKFLVEDDEDTYEYFYDGVDRVIRTRDPEGNLGNTAYDDNHNVIETREIDVSQVPGVSDDIFITTYFYDSLNRVQQTTDNIGQTMFYRYDSRDNLVAMADAQGPLTGESIVRRAFAPGPLTVNAINDFGNVTRYFYDGINRQTLQEVVLTDLLASTGETFSGDGEHVGASIFGVKDDPAVPESFTPPPDDDPIDGQGGGDGIIRTGYTYDDNSLLSSLIDDQGNVTVYLYDNLNRRVSETKGLTVDSLYTYANILGSRTIVTPSAATINSPRSISRTLVQRQLSAAESRIDVIAPLFESLADRVDDRPPTTIVWGYDPDDNVLILEDENDSEVFTDYDAINRSIAVRVFRAGQRDVHRFDPIFNPFPRGDRSNPTDRRNPPIVIGTNAENYQYDGLSRLVNATDNNEPESTDDDSIITYAYDSLSRVIEETQQIGPLGAEAITSAWRAENLRSSLTYPNDRQLGYTYDNLDRLNTVADVGAALPIVDYDYIGAFRVLVRAYPQNDTRMTYLNDAGNSVDGYDGLRRPTQLRHLRGDNSLIVGFTHEYDRMNNKLNEQKLHDPVNSETYAYDSAYRLINFDRPDAGAIDPLHSEWDLDGVGNWDQVDGLDRTHSSFNELLTENGTTFDYDDNGNQTVDGTNDLRYEWDYRNRLRRVTDADGNLIATYAYDAANRRIRKDVSNSGALDGTTDFYYDGWQVLEERDAVNALTQQYVYGNYIDEPLVLDRNLGGDDTATGPGDQRLFYHQNTLYSVHALTDTSADILEGYQYDAYGRQTVFEPGPNGVVNFGGDDVITEGRTSAVDNPYMYTGRRLDSETGLHYYRNRYQDSEQGRFLSRDPLGFTDSVNVYEYVQSRALNHKDPFGFLSLEECKANIKKVLEGKVTYNEYTSPDKVTYCFTGLTWKENVEATDAVGKLLHFALTNTRRYVAKAARWEEGGEVERRCLARICCKCGPCGGSWWRHTQTIDIHYQKTESDCSWSTALFHELIHASDWCRNQFQKRDCATQIKLEMRAYRKTGACATAAECFDRAKASVLKNPCTQVEIIAQRANADKLFKSAMSVPVAGLE